MQQSLWRISSASIYMLTANGLNSGSTRVQGRVGFGADLPFLIQYRVGSGYLCAGNSLVVYHFSL